MFLDIRNFTAFAEREPEEVVAYLNTIFELWSRRRCPTTAS